MAGIIFLFVPRAYGAIAFVGGSATTTETVTAPIGISTGDFMLAVFAHASVDTLTGPAGWVHLCQAQSQTADVYYKIATAGDTSGTTYSATGSTALSSGIGIWSGELPAAPIDSYKCIGNSSISTGIGNGSSTAISSTALDTMFANDERITGIVYEIGAGSGTLTAPGDETQAWNQATAPKMWLGYRAVSTVNAYTNPGYLIPETASQSVSDTWATFEVVLKPAATTQPSRDIYGGWTGLQCTGSGAGHAGSPPNPHFYFEKINQRWWWCDPLGNVGFYPAVALAMNYNSYIPSAIPARYSIAGGGGFVDTALGTSTSGFNDWTVNQVQRLRAWGVIPDIGALLTAISRDSRWVNATGLDESMPLKIPFVTDVLLTHYAIRSGGCGLAGSYALKNLRFYVDASATNLIPGYAYTMADYYDPQFPSCVSDQLAANAIAAYSGTSGNSAPQGDYWLYANVDESDQGGAWKGDQGAFNQVDNSITGSEGIWCSTTASSTTLTCFKPVAVTAGETVNISAASYSGTVASNSTGTTIALNSAPGVTTYNAYTQFGSTSVIFELDPAVHTGWLILASDPIQNIYPQVLSGGNNAIYTDHENYTKVASVNLLADKYVCTGSGTSQNGALACCTGPGTGTCSVDPASASYIGATNMTASNTLGALNTAWGSGYTTLGTTDAACSANLATCLSAGTYAAFGDHQITANCSSSPCSGTLTPHPINEVGYTLYFASANGNIGGSGDQAGAISGTGIASGTINDTSGAWSLTLNGGVSEATTYISWKSQAASTGTGLLDEDGSCPSRGANPCWMGEAVTLLDGHSPGSGTNIGAGIANAETTAMQADVNAIYSAYLDEYASIITSAYHSLVPGVPLLLEVGSYMPPHKEVLTELAKYFDLIMIDTVPPYLCEANRGCTDSQARVDYVGQYWGDKPWIDAANTFFANADSTQSAYVLTNPVYSTQLARGQGYQNVLIPALENAKPVGTGNYSLVGNNTIYFTDTQSRNFGIVTGVHNSLDNPYDGHCSIIAAATDPWGYPCGGELGNYGDFIDSYAAGNLDFYKDVTSAGSTGAYGGNFW